MKFTSKNRCTWFDNSSSIPFDLMTIGPNRNRAVVSWTPLTRDGGQMLSRKYQLYPMTAEREVPVGQ